MYYFFSHHNHNKNTSNSKSNSHKSTPSPPTLHPPVIMFCWDKVVHHIHRHTSTSSKVHWEGSHNHRHNLNTNGAKKARKRRKDYPQFLLELPQHIHSYVVQWVEPPVLRGTKGRATYPLPSTMQTLPTHTHTEQLSPTSIIAHIKQHPYGRGNYQVL